MAPDYYEMARELIQMLRIDGENECSSQLESVLLDGMGATEILMGLRHHLRAILGEENELTGATFRYAKALADQIDVALS